MFVGWAISEGITQRFGDDDFEPLVPRWERPTGVLA